MRDTKSKGDEFRRIECLNSCMHGAQPMALCSHRTSEKSTFEVEAHIKPLKNQSSMGCVMDTHTEKKKKKKQKNENEREEQKSNNFSSSSSSLTMGNGSPNRTEPNRETMA